MRQQYDLKISPVRDPSRLDALYNGVEGSEGSEGSEEFQEVSSKVQESQSNSSRHESRARGREAEEA